MHWVLLRGLVRESRHWESFPAQLQSAFPNATLHLLDLPGNGRLYQQNSLTSLKEMADCVSWQIEEKGLKEPVHVLALSLGGMIALEWMTRHPEQMASAVIINSSLRGISPFFDRLQWRVYPGLLLQLSGLQSDLQRERMIIKLTSHFCSDSNKLAVKWAEYARQNPTSRQNALRQLIAAARYRAPDRPPLKPLLLLSSEKDQIVKCQCSQKMAAQWRCPIKVHSEAGHDLTLDDGAWVIRQVMDWHASL